MGSFQLNNGHGGKDKDAYTRFGFFSIRDAFQFDFQMKYLVEGLITEGSLVCLFGHPETFKTFIVIFLGVCVANGLSFLGRTVKKGGVLFFDEENGKNRIAARIVMVGKGIGVETGSFNTTCFSNLEIPSENEEEHLITAIKEMNISLVVIDSLAALNKGNDENSVEFIQPFLMGLRRIIEATGCSIILIHHANKKGTYRGSSAISAGVDMMIRVTRKKNKVIFKIEKSRDFEASNFSTFVHFSGGAFLMSPGKYFSPSKSEQSSEFYILNSLRENDCSLQDLIDGTDGFAVGTIRNMVSNLIKEEKVKRADDGGQGKKAIYAFVDENDNYKEDNNV